MDVIHADFQSRAERSAYVAQRYGDRLRGRVLDVGCDERALEAHVLETGSYMGIDIGGDPTRVVDLEAAETLPFEDGAFDFVVCTDVLEHIDAMHRVFDEMVRVTRSGGGLVVSLPNCWRAVRRRVPRGAGTPRFYGLPVEKPADRHKWFFNVDDVAAFFEGQARRQPVRVVEQFATVKPRNPLDRSLRTLLAGGRRRYLNRHAVGVWTLLEKQ